MHRTWRRSVALLVVLASIALTASMASAADHLDAPNAMAEPAADINDVYVFRSTDSGNNAASDRTVFVMTVFPVADGNARFSDAVEYKIHAADLDNPGTVYTITCTADAEATQTITCEAPGGGTDVVTFGDTTDGDRGGNVDIIAFAGLREDPFFFDLEDFRTVYNSGDPSELVDDTGEDFFAGLNTLTIVVDVDNSVIGDGTTLGVWAQTTRIGN